MSRVSPFLGVGRTPMATRVEHRPNVPCCRGNELVGDPSAASAEASGASGCEQPMVGVEL